MKSKLQISVGILLFLVFLAVSSLAQTSGVLPGQPAFDPATGAPIPTPVPEWKDPEWKDPDIVLTNVAFNGEAIEGIVHSLRGSFHAEFDIVLPKNWGTVVRDLATGIPQRVEETPQDWGTTPVTLQLKNVKASEVFNAMNLIFENDRLPLRWELKLNGTRQIALLRVLVDPIPRNAPVPQQPLRRVYFVGDLLGNENHGGMNMEQLVKTITEVWQMTETAGGAIQFHKEAQLLVVTGTEQQLNFIEQTLSALQQKVALQAETKTKPEASKSGGGGSSR